MAGQTIEIPVKGVSLGAELNLPADALGLVLFAHGSGSSRHSPRNQFVAQTLLAAGMGTLLFDLLTAAEEQAEAVTRHLRFNIPLLADRLAEATHWALDRLTSRDLAVGYFGSSTGAAAALVAAAQLGETIAAVVSRGGRPDLAGEALERVTAATLLIVGGEDRPVVPLNEEAYERLSGQKALRIVPGATHLFEEPGPSRKSPPWPRNGSAITWPRWPSAARLTGEEAGGRISSLSSPAQPSDGSAPPKSQSVLDCASPLALSRPRGPKSGRGLPQSKTLRASKHRASIAWLAEGRRRWDAPEPCSPLQFLLTAAPGRWSIGLSKRTFDHDNAQDRFGVASGGPDSRHQLIPPLFRL